MEAYLEKVGLTDGSLIQTMVVQEDCANVTNHHIDFTSQLLPANPVHGASCQSAG
jgi:hypothetical protein